MCVLLSPVSRLAAEVVSLLLVWGKPVHSARVAITSTATVRVVTVLTLFSPTPVRVLVDTAVDFVSHEVGMVYGVALLVLVCRVVREQHVSMTVIVVAAEVTVEVVLHWYWTLRQGEPHSMPRGQQAPLVVSVGSMMQLVRRLVGRQQRGCVTCKWEMEAFGHGEDWGDRYSGGHTSGYGLGNRDWRPRAQYRRLHVMSAHGLES